jgi:integral membrane protein (TIGR01906 family)
LIGLFLAYRNESLLEFAQGLKLGGLLAAGLVAVIGLLAVLTWQVWFVVFHQVFFDPGTWTFNTSDTLIRLFPERFWYDAALTISGLSIFGGLGVAVVGWYVQRKSQYVPIPYRAQSFKPSKG